MLNPLLDAWGALLPQEIEFSHKSHKSLHKTAPRLLYPFQFFSEIIFCNVWKYSSLFTKLKPFQDGGDDPNCSKMWYQVLLAYWLVSPPILYGLYLSFNLQSIIARNITNGGHQYYDCNPPCRSLFPKLKAKSIGRKSGLLNDHHEKEILVVCFLSETQMHQFLEVYSSTPWSWVQCWMGDTSKNLKQMHQLEFYSTPLIHCWMWDTFECSWCI